MTTCRARGPTSTTAAGAGIGSRRGAGATAETNQTPMRCARQIIATARARGHEAPPAPKLSNGAVARMFQAVRLCGGDKHCFARLNLEDASRARVDTSDRAGSAAARRRAGGRARRAGRSSPRPVARRPRDGVVVAAADAGDRAAGDACASAVGRRRRRTRRARARIAPDARPRRQPRARRVRDRSQPARRRGRFGSPSATKC